jgi:carboxyl-terminal processing protease
VLAVGALVVSFGAGMVFQREVVADENGDAVEATVPLYRAWDIVLENYVEESAINQDRMLEGAIEGMLSTLGDEGHTRYLTAEETEIDRQHSRGVYYGVGIQVREEEDEGLVVTRTFPGSAAEEEGVAPGDIVIAVNGEDVTAMPIDDIILLIRGPEGTRVTISVARPSTSEELEFDLERREIEVSAVSWKMLEDNVALLRLEQFSTRSGDDLARALSDAQAEGAEAVVLDLRGNPGGLVREAKRVASMFIPDDAPIYISRTRDGGEETHRAELEDAHIGDIPMVVLIDHSSASASEIVSGAIKAQDGSATVIGETTVGTGTVLRQYDLGDGSTIWLGVELWLTPEGQMIRDEGVTPDIVVPLAEGQQPYFPTADQPAPPASELNDDQLEYALDLLDGTVGSAPFPAWQAHPTSPW